MRIRSRPDSPPDDPYQMALFPPVRGKSMSKGSPRVIVRFPPDLLDRVVAQIEQLNTTSAAAPPDVSQFVRKAVEEKLDHYRRSRRKRARKPRLSDLPVEQRPVGWSVLLRGGRS